MRKNRYIVDFGERPVFANGEVLYSYREIEVVDAISKGEVRKRLKCKSKNIVFMRCLGN